MTSEPLQFVKEISGERDIWLQDVDIVPKWSFTWSNQLWHSSDIWLLLNWCEFWFAALSFCLPNPLFFLPSFQPLFHFHQLLSLFVLSLPSQINRRSLFLRMAWNHSVFLCRVFSLLIQIYESLMRQHKEDEFYPHIQSFLGKSDLKGTLALVLVQEVQKLSDLKTILDTGHEEHDSWSIVLPFKF